MTEFCRIIFPDLENNIHDPEWLAGRTILAPTNREVDALNDILQNWVPRNIINLTSADSLEDYRDIMRFNVEYINTLCPNGFPRHVISLKKGMIIMLLRNISPKDGLCNGTKLIFEKVLENKLLICKFPYSDKTVLIQRKKFKEYSKFYAFE